MKKYAAFFRGMELDVYAETQEEARKTALAGFVSHLENELDVIEMQVRTERCDICQYTYTPSEIVKRDGDQLCWSCNQDTYHFEDMNLNDIDIPF